MRPASRHRHWPATPSPAIPCRSPRRHPRATVAKHNFPELRRNSTRPVIPTTSPVSMSGGRSGYSCLSAANVVVLGTPTGYGSTPSSSRRCRFSRRTRICSGSSSPSPTAGFVGSVTDRKPTCRASVDRPPGRRVGEHPCAGSQWTRDSGGMDHPADAGRRRPAVRADDLATSFELRAAEYARLRPDYPACAVDAAVPAAAGTVLDLAAGTGKLTAPLVDRGYRRHRRRAAAVACWPSCAGCSPVPHAVAGTAEDLPLADGTVDAVVVGQAFHWFDQRQGARRDRPGAATRRHARAAVESRRRARSAGPRCRGGAEPDRQARRAGAPGWATGSGDVRADRSRGGDPAGAAVPRPSRLPRPGGDRGHQVAAPRSSVEDFIALQHTYSYVIRASAAVRAQLDVELPADRPRARRPEPRRSRCR